MAPATWWATYGKAMPLLSAVAGQVLAQPVRVVGRAQLVRLRQDQDGRVLTRMGHEVADKRKSVYCHEALHLKEKLQSAGYTQAEAGTPTRPPTRPRPRPTWLYSAASVRA